MEPRDLERLLHIQEYCDEIGEQLRGLALIMRLSVVTRIFKNRFPLVFFKSES